MVFWTRPLLFAIGLCAAGVVAAGAAANASPTMSRMGPALASDDVDFSLHLPLRHVAELDGLIESQSSAGSPLYHHWLTPAQFRASYGPDPARVAAVLGVLHAAGLQAARTSTQVISVHGSAQAIERLLATKLSRVADARTGRTRIAALASYTLPAPLIASGATLLHLQPGVLRKPMLHRRGLVPGANPLNRYGAEGPYWADDLKQAYALPAYQTTNGSGVSIAIVDGGDFSDADLALYLAHEKVGSLKGDLAPAPKTVHVLLPGAHKFTADPNAPTYGDSFEADLDAQQIALAAPGATLTAVITADDSDGSFQDAYIQIIESNAYDIVSTSYGSCELFYLPAYAAVFGGNDGVGILKAEEDLYKQGNAQGITFVNASGDNGALDCPALGYFTKPPTSPATVYPSVLSVDSPADMPNVIGVGGGDLTTSSTAAGSRRSTYVSEQSLAGPDTEDAYGTGNLVSEIIAGGGGVSTVFARPAYQKLVNTGSTMRTVPDVGGHFGGYTATGSYDTEIFGGQLTGVLGTSASCPFFAAVLALKESVQHSRLGLENPDIYNLSAHNGSLGYYYFHQSNPGSDGYYTYTRAHQGYNYIYGVGSPHGANFALLPFSPLAGDPQTLSNP